MCPFPTAPFLASLWVLGAAPENAEGICPNGKKKNKPTNQQTIGLNITQSRTFFPLLIPSALLKEMDSANIAVKNKNQIAAWKACWWERELGHPRTAGGKLRSEAVLVRSLSPLS